MRSLLPRLLAVFLLFLGVIHIDVSAQNESEIKAIETNLTPSLQIKGEPVEKMTVEEIMAAYSVVNLSVAVIKDGKVKWAKGYGKANDEGSMVDKNTLFQAASISKPVAAAGIHKLVQMGKLDLDKDVNEYLTSWKVPPSNFTDKEKVTLRRLMTHSAGTTVHGFPGYGPDEIFPTDVMVLNGDGNTDAVVVDTTPGVINRYSGGGYTIMERVMEDVTEQDFASFMKDEILIPFGMEQSTYEQPLPEDRINQASFAYNREGGLYPGNYHHYPEQAAAGLWTTPSDLANFLIGIQNAYAGNFSNPINQEMAKIFLTRHTLGHGHGPGLMGEGDDLAFGHGGKNAGFTCNMYASAKNGYGMIIMSGSDGARPVIDAVQRSIAEYYGWEWEKAEVIELIDISDEDLLGYCGNYFYKPASMTVTLTPVSGKLRVEVQSVEQAMLHHLGNHQFIDMSDGTRIQFLMDESGKCTGLIQGGRVELEKIE